MNRINKNRKFKQYRNNILDTNINLFGKQLDYKIGDIVIWRGQNPAILRIKSIKMNHCYEATVNGYNSMHFSHLRLATIKEIQYLGSAEFKIIKL